MLGDEEGTGTSPWADFIPPTGVCCVENTAGRLYHFRDAHNTPEHTVWCENDANPRFHDFHVPVAACTESETQACNHGESGLPADTTPNDRIAGYFAVPQQE